jgi:ribonuclease P protein subunit RPR2
MFYMGTYSTLRLGLADKGEVRREMERWTYAAARSVEGDPELAERQARNALKLRLRARVKPPYELKLFFCRKCKEFAPPPRHSTVRIRNGWLVIRCKKCGGIYRKKLKPPKAGARGAQSASV